MKAIPSVVLINDAGDRIELSEHVTRDLIVELDPIGRTKLYVPYSLNHYVGQTLDLYVGPLFVPVYPDLYEIPPAWKFWKWLSRYEHLDDNYWMLKQYEEDRKYGYSFGVGRLYRDVKVVARRG